MEKDIPLKIEILSSEDDDQYLITSAREIEFILHHIAESGSRIALYYGDNDDFILTTLLGVNASGLWLEPSQSNKINTRITESAQLIFVSSHAKVKVQFSTTQARDEIYQGQATFFLSFPYSIYRLQRREYFRLITPITNPLRCIIPSPAASPNPSEITIMDISGGGVGLTCTEQGVDLSPGETYTNCKIDLPDTGELMGTIEVKNLVVLNTPAGQTVRRAGCEFKELDGASNILLQRYVTAMQRTREKL